MTIAPLRLFHPSKGDRIAAVTVEPSSEPGRFVVTVARGPKRTALTARLFGPFSESEMALAHKSILDGLLGEGYVRAGLGQLLLALQEKNPKVRARAASRLAWRKDRSAVELLLALLDKPKDDVSTVVDALGLIGDARAIPALRVEAEKKLLSRRRAGVEALRNLGDLDGLKAARERAVERLPEALKKIIDGTSAQAIEQALLTVDVKERGLALDTVYELAGLPASLQANARGLAQTARGVVHASEIDKPNMWRYAKSVWKRAMLRHDFETFGFLTRRIEVRGRTAKPTLASLKSGYDGEVKKTRVFGKHTVTYVRRRAWRYLRRLARHQPEAYAVAAAWAIAPYVDGDDVLKGNSPATGRSYLLHRVLFGASQRYDFHGRTMRFVTVKGASGSGAKIAQVSDIREEAFAELWDLSPRAYVILLGHARHTLVQRFALEGILRSPTALHAATHAEVAALLESDDARIVDLGLQELRRRFDPKKPDLELVIELAGSAKDLIRNHGLVWLNETAAVWATDSAWILRFLAMPHPAARDAAARVVSASVRGLPSAQRGALAQALLAHLAHKESEEGAHSGYAEVLRTGLFQEAADATSIAQAIAMLEGSDSALSVGAAILANKAGALELLGATKVLGMATHEKAAVRAAAMTLLAKSLASLAKDPSALFGLIESDWDDVRTAAIAMLDTIDLSPLGLDGLMGLADSTRIDVQKKACQVIEKALTDSAIDVHELLARVGQHPSPFMRAFAVELVTKRLKPGSIDGSADGRVDGRVGLDKLEMLFRAALFDVWPDRKVKRAVIAFLDERGQQDENQAQVAAHILGDFVRTQTQDDKERALMAIVHIALKFPNVKSPVVLTAVPTELKASVAS